MSAQISDLGKAISLLEDLINGSLLDDVGNRDDDGFSAYLIFDDTDIDRLQLSQWFNKAVEARNLLKELNNHVPTHSPEVCDR